MNTWTRCAAGAVTALAVIAPITAASAARAHPARHWTTIETFEGGKQQACKVAGDRGRSWVIYNRLDAHLVKSTSGKVEATLAVTLHGNATKRVWDSGWVTPGHTSNIRTITLPRAAGYGLMMTIHGTDAGSGGIPTIARIGRC